MGTPRRQRGPLWIASVTVFSAVLVLAGAAGVWWWVGSWSQTYTGESGGLSYTVVMPGQLHRVAPVRDESIPSEMGLKFRLDGQDDGGGSIAVGSVADELASVPTTEVVRQAREAFSIYNDDPGEWFHVDEGMVGRFPASVLDIKQDFGGHVAYLRYYIFEVKKRSPTMFVACAWNPVYTAPIEDSCRDVAASFTYNLSSPA